MHRHDPGEIYYVLEGQFSFYVGYPDTRRVTATAGDVVPLAGGTPHTIRNESTADAVAFVVHAPGAPMERFSRAAATLASNSDGSPSMDAVLAIAAQHGIELLGPIPGPTSEPAPVSGHSTLDEQPLNQSSPSLQGSPSFRSGS